MGNTVKVKYKFGAWQMVFSQKNPFDVNIFLSHMKYGQKLKNLAMEHECF